MEALKKQSRYWNSWCLHSDGAVERYINKSVICAMKKLKQ